MKQLHSSLCRALFAWLILIAVPAQAGEPPAAAVVSANPLATEAGIEILEKGGNAFDAAVAVAATLSVARPYSAGLGGGAFFLIHRAEDGREIMIDARETAPAAAHKRMYLDSQDNVIPGLSVNGPLAAGIPGLVAGMAYMADVYGTLPLKELLKPAIHHARHGFKVTKLYQEITSWRLDVLKQYPEAASIFVPGGRIPQIGERIVQRDLARVLEDIARYGASAFYHGPLAQKLVTGVREAGGIWRVEDLANYRIRERHPLVMNYRGVRVVSASPPSSGGIVLAQALTMLEQFDLHRMDNITRKQTVIEAMRRAYRDRAVFLGDPDFVDIPTDKLLDENYLTGLALTIDPTRATPSEVLGDTPGFESQGSDTTHFSIIDAAGNRVAGTMSINLPFGSCFVVPGTGVVLNDEMDDFAVKEHVPNAYGLVGEEANAVQPGKRPLSSMTPTFVETADRIGILGTPGGSRIISMVLLGVLDFEAGNGPESWVSLPRYHHQYLPDEVQFEQGGLTVEEQEKLKAMGHALNERGYNYGDMHAILWDKRNNKVEAAADPRGEGTAEILKKR